VIQENQIVLLSVQLPACGLGTATPGHSELCMNEDVPDENEIILIIFDQEDTGTRSRLSHRFFSVPVHRNEMMMGRGKGNTKSVELSSFADGVRVSSQTGLPPEE
jgi:hypothetical protein